MAEARKKESNASQGMLAMQGRNSMYFEERSCLDSDSWSLISWLILHTGPCPLQSPSPDHSPLSTVGHAPCRPAPTNPPVTLLSMPAVTGGPATAPLPRASPVEATATIPCETHAGRLYRSHVQRIYPGRLWKKLPRCGERTPFLYCVSRVLCIKPFCSSSEARHVTGPPWPNQELRQTSVTDTSFLPDRESSIAPSGSRG